MGPPRVYYRYDSPPSSKPINSPRLQVFVPTHQTPPLLGLFQLLPVFSQKKPVIYLSKMLANVIVYAALLATSALGAALPAATIPSDATPIKGGFTFEAGTQAEAWVRAQIALGESSTAIGIGMFTTKDCLEGHGAWFEDVQYGIRNTDIVPYRFWAVGIAGRALKSDEKLAFSQKGRGANNVGDYCATPISSVAGGTGVGCINVQDINCFQLSRV